MQTWGFLGKSGSQCRLPLHKLGHLSVKGNLLKTLFLNKIQSSNLKTRRSLPKGFPVWNRLPIPTCLGCCHFGQNQLDLGACLKSLQLPVALFPHSSRLDQSMLAGYLFKDWALYSYVLCPWLT